MGTIVLFVILLIIGLILAWLDPDPTKLEDVKSGTDYERYCANALRANGWTVTHTGQSGDQGCDLIARKNGYRVAIQCKFYSKKVGNRAVQEVISGAIFTSSTRAVVIASNRYTDGAYELARKANVILISHDEIAKLEGKIVRKLT
jgi:restriction system protein